MGCGGIEKGGTSADASTDGGPVDTCPSVSDPQAPIVVSQLSAEYMGNVAASGCAFASAWVELRSGTPVVAAATLEPTSGGWIASSVAVLATLSSQDLLVNSPIIASDGAGGFVVVWGSNGSMSLRDLSADGTPGPTIPVPVSGNYLYPEWVEADGLSGYRIGYLGGAAVDGGSVISYLAYFAHVGADGSLLGGPTVVTPAETPNANVDVVGFARASDHNTVAWVLNGGPTVQAFVSDFDDSGMAAGSASPLLSSDSIQTSRHGLAIAANDAYFGVWEPGTGVIVGRGLTAAYAPVAVAGDDRPALAFSEDGDLGVLASDGMDALHFSVVRAGATVATSVLSPNGGYPYDYALAGGASSFAVVWSSASGVSARIVTP